MNLQDKLQILPSSPGVYLMKDSHGGIIYVGKAKNLKNRVQSYFRHSKDHSPKVKKLIQHLKDFEWLVTDTEFEALLLECQLIKEIKPMYNRMMKNPQSFIYIVIDLDKEIPTFCTTYNSVENKGKCCFGPYTSKQLVEKAIQGIKEAFKIACSHNTKRNTACLNYSIGLCIGTCLGDSVAIKHYRRIMNNIVALLNGTNFKLLEEMEEMMLSAAADAQFEAAAKYRDYIQSLNVLLKKEKVIEFTEDNHNIALIEWLDSNTFKLLLIKRTFILFNEKKTGSIDQIASWIKEKISTTFLEAMAPFQDVGRDEIDQAQIIYSYIQNNLNRTIIIPDKWLKYENNLQIEKAIYSILDEETNTYFSKKNPN